MLIQFLTAGYKACHKKSHPPWEIHVIYCIINLEPVWYDYITTCTCIPVCKPQGGKNEINQNLNYPGEMYIDQQWYNW